MNASIGNGQRLQKFYEKLMGPPNMFTITVIGNSVARFHHFGTVNTFVNKLRQWFPQHSFQIIQNVKGGESPSILYRRNNESKNSNKIDEGFGKGFKKEQISL